jgi:hypothetical protein
MIVGVILLRTESYFNGWQGQAKGRNGAALLAAAGRDRSEQIYHNTERSQRSQRRKQSPGGNPSSAKPPDIFKFIFCLRDLCVL